MKYILTILFLFMLLGKVFAVGLCTLTSNDNCADAITLTVGAACTDGCTEDATTEGGEALDCASGNQTIWYTYTATSAGQQVNVWQDATGGCFNGSVVWDGSGGCLPTVALSCHDAGNGPTDQAHLLTTQTIGNTYYIQVTYSDFGPCAPSVDVCVEVIPYDPCDGCGDVCYSACEFITAPATADVTCCCSSSAYNPPMHERDRIECYAFTANSTSTTFSAILSSNCGGGQFTKLEWTLSNSACGVVEGPTSIFVDNNATTVAGNTYTVCYDMTFAECNISEMWAYVIVGGVLPIELLSFEGEIMDNVTILTWVTASESNNDYFTIEKSDDGQLFYSIGYIAGAGNSSQNLVYQYVDDCLSTGIMYYRLKQTDFDGQFDYSHIISLKMEESSNIKNTYYSINGQRLGFKIYEELPIGIYIVFDGYNYKKIIKVNRY